jgi:predicted phage tail protein
VPSAPTSATVTTTLSVRNALFVNWGTPSSNGGSAVIGYRIEQSTDGTNWTTAVANTGATTQWYARGLTNGQAYQFRISAMNSNGYGTPTIVSGTPMFAPSMPLNQNIVAGDRRATVSWSAPADNGGSPISGYRVEACVESSTNYCSNANVFNVVIANTGLVNSYTVTGLTNGTIYAIRVFAINDVDINTYQHAYEYLLARPAAAPIAPNVVYTTTGNRFINLFWGGATANGYTITGYKVEQTVDNGATWTTSSSTRNTPSQSLAALFA